MKRFFLSLGFIGMVFFAIPRLALAILPGCPAGCQAPVNENFQDSQDGSGSVVTPTDQGSSDGTSVPDTSTASQNSSGGAGNSSDFSSSDSGTQGGNGSMNVNQGAGAGSMGGEIIYNDVVALDAIPKVPMPDQCQLILEGKNVFTNDEDADGLYPEQELSLGTLANDPDTDYDSYFDGQEVCLAYDPLNPPVVNPINTALMAKLKGKILLQVERDGQAWYMYPVDSKRYYLRNGPVAYQVMRFLSLGITDADLAKIPVGIEARFADTDTDGDLLTDKTEEGLKTDPANHDTDGDGVDDGDEVLKYATNPLGLGSLHYDNKLTSSLRGRILLQVQSRGEAWYVNPFDSKRYYLKDGAAAYAVMRFLSLGITNKDLAGLPYGTLRGKVSP